MAASKHNPEQHMPIVHRQLPAGLDWSTRGIAAKVFCQSKVIELLQGDQWHIDGSFMLYVDSI